MSPKSAGQAVKAGYKNVRVMLAGEPAWEKALYPSYAGYGFICQGNNVIIDLRSKDKDAQSRIPRSVSIPFAELADRIDDIPIKAPVVLYSDNEKESIEAMKMLRDAGFKKVSLVTGGYQGWKKLGGKLIKGPVVTDIHWQRKLGEGEVSLAEFNKALKDPTRAIILDVRTNEEVQEGKLKQSRHIPLDELCSRMDDFFATIDGMSKNQKIYVHCTTGARAEMAYKELKKNGYNAYYLVADVECDGDECEIEE
jgi:rhodanese-related sulfurtransferase